MFVEVARPVRHVPSVDARAIWTALGGPVAHGAASRVLVVVVVSGHAVLILCRHRLSRLECARSHLRRVVVSSAPN